MKSNKEKISQKIKKQIESLGGIFNSEDINGDRQMAVLLGELQIAQLELEMQNDELLISSNLLESERTKFAGFFNLAPVGYFILDHLGHVIEVNQIGAKLLGIAKEKILEQRFQSFINSNDYENFYNFLQRLKANQKKESKEFKLRSKGKGPQEICARIEGIAINSNFTNELQFYVAVIDVTKEKLIAKAMFELEDEKQKLVLSTQLGAQENERFKISGILHDSICQLLYGIRLNLQHIQFNHKEAEFKNVHQLIAQAIKETRELSYELTPSVLRDFGLIAGLREMVERISTPHFKIALQLDKASDSLSTEIQLSVFRIVQELLNNCIKHANATKAKVVVKLEDGHVCICVSDNGIGFAEDFEMATMHGSGLRGIKNRISLLNGELTMKPLKNGSEINIKFKNEMLA
jgi:PAS domain S-box-containing protein